jgi:hypothetical protein
MTNQPQRAATAKALTTGVGQEAARPGRPLREPYLTPGGDLVIPFDSDPKYHWWKGGQSVKNTIAELKAARNQGA